MQTRPDHTAGHEPPHPVGFLHGTAAHGTASHGTAPHGTAHGLAQRLPKRTSASLLGALLAAFLLAALLAGCGPMGSADSRDAAGVPQPTEQTSADPQEAPAAEQTAPAAETTAEETAAADATPAPQPEQAPEPESADGTALAMLAELEEKGRAPKTGYDRDSFGWRDDLDRNGCDTRNDILRRDLHTLTLRSGTDGCVVLYGTLDSPYSGETVSFDRTDSTIDIDHLVALSDAWQTGAAAWDADLRREFANDPLNLLAVELSLNRQKGAGDAATWLPLKKDYRCEYVGRQIAVKAKYDLWVKPAEADAMERVLADCEGFLAIADEDPWPATGQGDVVATEAQPAPQPEPAPAPAPAPTEDAGSSGSSDTSSGSVYFQNCDAARAAGAAPVHAGDPGYRKGLDRDGDGVGCE